MSVPLRRREVGVASQGLNRRGRSDAVVLISTAEMEDRDLTGRTLWTGVALTPEELELLRVHVVNQEEDIASKLIARLPMKPNGNP